MRTLSSRRSLLLSARRGAAVIASAAALLAVTGATASAAPPGPAAPSQAAAAGKQTTATGKQCERRVLTEPQTENLQNVDVADPKVGQVGIYHDKFTDAKGANAGTVMGRYEIRHRAPDGAVWTYYTEDLFLVDGVIHAEGWVDFNDVKNTKWVGYRAQGLDGVYQGKTGWREWRNTGVDGAPADARWQLCG
ncbi:hypothetical protein ACFZCY_43725 [Streptomyces sp. NPDC007983]|uniref:allene oxide cyclase barrel-like domain-containing protein n=1 Tax=Streptomyces sp. NPDC007983 TaxID=3364800 RepID=UPI0036DFE6AA